VIEEPEERMTANSDRTPCDGTTLITGATGFVGGELLRHLLAALPDIRIVALVRAGDDASAQRRREILLAGLAPEQAARVDVLRGDVTLECFGLEPRRWAQLLDTTDRVLHCAASTRFDLSLEHARRENVHSTAHVLELCRALRSRGRSGRLDHVSTAFVAGCRQGLVGEEELQVGQAFHNTYEQTKLEAELLCRRASADLPLVLHRPSIVVGRQSSGETTSYKAAYGPMRLLINAYNSCPALLNRLVPLPLPPSLNVDLVPVDYVAAAITALWSRADAVGRSYHLAAGPGGTATLEELVYLTCDFFGTPRLRFVEPGKTLRALGRLAAVPLERLAPRVASTAKITFAYGLGMPSFDTTNAVAAGLSPPPVRRYFERILRFATRTRFGRDELAARSARYARDGASSPATDGGPLGEHVTETFDALLTAPAPQSYSRASSTLTDPMASRS
jgi:thioester reductase-like protein